MVFIVPALLAGFSAPELVVGRYLVYGLISLLLMLPAPWRLLRRLTRGDWLVLLRQAAAGNLVYYLLLSLGVELAGVAPTSLIIGLLPVSVTLLGHGDDGAVPLRRMAAPLLLVAAGIACINADVFKHASAAGHGVAATLLGLLAATGALLCWSWYALDNARFLKANPRFGSGEWSGLYGLCSGLMAAVLGALVWLLGGAGTQPAHTAPPRDWVLFWSVNTVIALGASTIGNRLWNVASRRVPVTLSGQLILFETLFALLYGFIYAQRLPRTLELGALVLLIGGMAWSARLHDEQA
jgi:drug/metabolite transporter (DMT)-like permease